MIGHSLHPGKADAALVEMLRIDPQGDDDGQEEETNKDDRPAWSEGPMRSRVGVPADPVEGHYDNAAGQDGDHVGDEEQERTERLMRCSGLECQSHHRQRGHEGDGDRHPRESVGDVRTGQSHRPDRPCGQSGHQIDDPRGDSRRHLTARGGHNRVGDQESEDPGQQHDGSGSGHDQQEGSPEIGSVGQYDGQHDAEDRSHERRHDHGADDGGRGIADHSR